MSFATKKESYLFPPEIPLDPFWSWFMRMLTRRDKNKKESGCSLFCDPAGIRTQDPILKRDVLYLLSYWVNIFRTFVCFCWVASFKLLLLYAPFVFKSDAKVQVFFSTPNVFATFFDFYFLKKSLYWRHFP